MLNIRGSINPRESGPSTADGTTPGSAAECFWAAGFNNRFVSNVAASCRNPVQQIVSGPGWKFIVPAAPYTARNPRFRGADMTDTSQTVAVTPQQQPILEFRGNEVYGLAADGLTAWQLGTDGYGIIPQRDGRKPHQRLPRVAHLRRSDLQLPAHRMTVDGLVYRVDPAATLYWPAAFQCGDYRNVDITIRGGSIHAGSVFGGCTDPLGTFRIERVDAVTWGHAFSFETPATPGTGADRPASGVTMIAAKQRRSCVAWSSAADDRDEPHDVEGQQPAERQVRHLRLRLPGTDRATTSASISASRPRRVSTAVLHPAATRRRGRRSTASRAQ